MKNILIIYSHWYPSNLAGVHRPRLIGNFLPELGWHPIVLTVRPEYFEETPDSNFQKTFCDGFEEIRVNAFKIIKPRIIGDIGLRSFFQIRKVAIKLCKETKIDFIWIPIPSFYMALMGRILYKKTKIPYGIDYIDPWVRDISNRKNFRAILSNKIARFLEPIAVKKASLITGVSYEYYKPVLERNFPSLFQSPFKNHHSKITIHHSSFPYGFDPHDHEIVLKNITYPWDDYPDCIPFIYAGAFLPNSGLFTQLFFRGLKKLIDKGQIGLNIKLFFIGTGNYSHKSIAEYAKEEGVEEHVIEIRDRFPFLHVLNFLSAAKGIIVLGSTEKHYTASKIFQSLLSKNPVFAVFHYESTVNEILKESKADSYLVKYNPDVDEDILLEEIKKTILDYFNQTVLWEPDLSALDKYSAREGARKLVEAMEKCIEHG